MNQPSLNLPNRPRELPSLHEVVRELLRVNAPRKDSIVAAQLGMSESHFSELKNSNGAKNEKHWPEAALRRISEDYDPEGRIAACVARWSGREVRVSRKWTDAEYRRRSEAVIRQQGQLGETWRALMEQVPNEEVEDGR